MSVTGRVNGNTVIISVSGRFDFTCHKDFREAYRNTTSGNSNEFIVDMTTAEYIDSSALGMLLLLREHAGSEQSSVSLKGCRNEVKDTLVLSHFDKLFKIS